MTDTIDVAALVERLRGTAAVTDRIAHAEWCGETAVPVEGYSSEARLMREAATALQSQADALADRIVDKLLARLRAADADSLDRLLLQGMIDKANGS